MIAEKTVRWKKASSITKESCKTDWLVKDLEIAPGRPACVYGKASAGKTLAILALELDIVLGRPVWGKFACRKGRVRHLDLDHGLAEARISRLAEGAGVAMSELDDLEISDDAHLNLVHGSDDMWEQAMRGFDLLVLDAVRNVVPGIDENDSRMHERLQRLGDPSKKTGCSVILLHHAKKGHVEAGDMDGMRGSGGIQGACGLIYRVSGSGNVRSWSRQRRHLAAFGSELEPFSLELFESGESIRIEVEGRCDNLPAEIQRQLMALPGVTQSQLIERLKQANVKKRNADIVAEIDKLAGQGLVTMRRGANNSKLLSWEVPS